MVLIIPYIFRYLLQYLGAQTTASGIERIFYGKWSAVILLVVIIAYWILRNLFIKSKLSFIATFLSETTV